MVDDGSTDESLAILNEWAQQQPTLVTVLSKENGGQGSARNLGLENARGEWITFIDPDDWIADDYLETVDRFIRKHPGAMLVGTYRVFVDEPEMTIRDRHPLRGLFRGGDKLINLDRFPDFFHGSAPSAFVRRELVEQQQLRFNTRIQPNFEDGHFCASYLLGLDGTPRLGLVRSARYFYRKRADGSSTLNQSLLNPRRFTDVPKYGYLALLQQATNARGEAPRWLKNMIIYELSFYFSSDGTAMSAATAAVGEVGREFVELLADIVALIGIDAINGFTIRQLSQTWIDVMAHGLGGDWNSPHVAAQDYDSVNKEVLISCRFAGREPNLQCFHRGRRIAPSHQKVRSIEYFGQQLLFEKLAWVRADGTLRFAIDGRVVPIRKGHPTTMAPTSIRPQVLEKWFKANPRPHPLTGVQLIKRLVLQRISSIRQRYSITAVYDRWTIAIAQWKSVEKVFADAWIFMDRVYDANDSAEVLFKSVRDNHPEINAWFVLMRGTPDWDRLKPMAGSRLLPYGSFRWKLAMLNCHHLISSHNDNPVLRPPEITRLAPVRYRFTFLQHGVIKDDLSRWLNGKRMNLMITSTEAEYQSIIGNLTPYLLTSKEVKLTGLPRFDALTAAASSQGNRPPDLLLIAPTWRHWLNQRTPDGGVDKGRLFDLIESEYFTMWKAVLGSERLKDISERSGLTIAFLPHPNVRPAVPAFDLDSNILILDHSDARLHSKFAQSKLVLTDYSSVAFNLAYLKRPVVYFQFDFERFMSGGHTSRPGYFDYERDGFGPVVYTPDDAVAAVATILDGDLSPKYLDQIESAIPFRDGRCSERVIQEIMQLG